MENLSGMQGRLGWLGSLKDLKYSNLVSLAEYTMVNYMSGEPAFRWWVKETLRHLDRIISNVNPIIVSNHIIFYVIPQDSKRGV